MAKIYQGEIAMSDVDTTLMRLSAHITGRVQGVSFRAYTLRKAQELALTGWVQNTPAGEVMTVAEGPRTQLLEFEQFLHEGSPASHVTNVKVAWQEPTGEFATFQIRYF